jgi:hypothetical protein
MNEKNLQYLKENLKYLGFGDTLQDKLEHHIRQGFPEFTLKLTTQFNGKPVEAELYFRRGTQTDHYFFNRYEARMSNAAGTGEDRSQSFYMNKGTGVTLKEAFNLLEGRAVHKQLLSAEGNTYKAWLQLDFNHKEENGQYKVRKFYDGYGFNLEHSTQKLHQQLSFREFTDPAARERVIQSLEKGNRQGVNARLNGEERYLYLEANPQMKTLEVLDKDYRRLRLEGPPSEKLSDRSAHLTSGKSASVPPEQGGVKEEHSNGLLEKKRTSPNKGLTP